MGQKVPVHTVLLNQLYPARVGERGYKYGLLFALAGVLGGLLAAFLVGDRGEDVFRLEYVCIVQGSHDRLFADHPVRLRYGLQGQATGLDLKAGCCGEDAQRMSPLFRIHLPSIF